MAAPLDGGGLPRLNNNPEALRVQLLQMSRWGRANGNNSPEMPLTRVDEAGGANHGNFRPGHVVGVIAD